MFIKVMKKFIFCLIILLISSYACFAQTPRFAADLKLLTTYEETDASLKKINRPYLAVYKKDKKTLVYLVSFRDSSSELSLTDYAFKKYKPEVVLIDKPRDLMYFSPKCSGTASDYYAGLAAENNIPVVLASTNNIDDIKILMNRDPETGIKNQAMWVILSGMISERTEVKRGGLQSEIANYSTLHLEGGRPAMNAVQFNKWFKDNFGREFEKTDLREFFGELWLVPSLNGTLFQKHAAENFLYVKDPFTLENIAAALNKYNVVFAAFNYMRYASQYKVLEKMLGTPQFVYEPFGHEIPPCPYGGLKIDVLIENPLN